MPCYMVIDWEKQEMDEDVFDQMVEALHQSQTPPTPRKPQSTRWQPNGTYNKKRLDPNYFRKYYQQNLKTPFTCPDCGQTISSKSNLSKHRHTKKCMNSKCNWTQIALQPETQKFQQATHYPKNT